MRRLIDMLEMFLYSGASDESARLRIQNELEAPPMSALAGPERPRRRRRGGMSLEDARRTQRNADEYDRSVTRG